MATSSIDLEGMAALFTSLETASRRLHAVPQSLRVRADRLDVSTTALTRLEQIAAWADDELPGLRRRLNLAIAADSQRPMGLRGTPVRITEPTMTMEQATQLGRDLAGRLEAADLCHDAQAFDALAAEVAAHAGDPDVMSAFVEALGAQGLLEVMNQVAVPPLNPVATIDTDSRASLLAALKSGLATADMVWPADRSAQFATALVEAATAGSSCSVLSYLLYDSQYSVAFLGAAADAVDAFDRTGWDGGPGRWSPDAVPGYWGLYFPEGAAGAYADPVVSLMTALALQPEVAQEFFSGGPGVTVPIAGQDLQVAARLQYYIQDREWVSEAAAGEALGRALVGATTVLRDRSESGRVSAQIASQAFALMGEKIGQVDDVGQAWDIPTGMRAHVAQMLASYGTDMFCAITFGSDRLEDGWAQLDDPGSVAVFPDGLAYGAAMNRALLERIVGSIGADTTPVFLDDRGRIITGAVDPSDEGLTQVTSVQILMSGVTVASQLAITTGLDKAMVQTPDTAASHLMLGWSIPAIDNALLNSASVMGWVVDAAFTGASNDEARAAARDKMLTDALNATMALPYLKLGEPIAQWALDQGRLAVVRSIQAGAPVEATEAIEGIDEELPGAVSHMVMNLLLQAGYLEPSVFDAVNAEAGGDRYQAPDRGDGGFVIPGDPPHFDLNSDEYTRWLRSEGPSVLLQDRIVGPYKDQYAGIGR